jgi:hypothetical protein
MKKTEEQALTTMRSLATQFMQNAEPHPKVECMVLMFTQSDPVKSAGFAVKMSHVGAMFTMNALMDRMGVPPESQQQVRDLLAPKPIEVEPEKPSLEIVSR